MSCQISSSYSLGCKSGPSGIRTLYIFDSPITGVTYSGASSDNEFVSNIAGATGSTVYSFELYRGGSNFTEAMAGDPANGTVVYTQTITALFRDFNTQLRNQFKLLALSGKVQAMVRTNRDEYILFGLDFDGGDATAINLASGTAYTDRMGYDASIVFLQANPASFVNVVNNNVNGVLTGFSLG